MKSKIIYVFVFLIFISSVFSSNIDIEITTKDVFTDGEKIVIDYSIISNEDIDILYDFHYMCGYNNPVPLILREEINLKKNQAYSKHIEDILINEYISPAECTAYIKIIEPFEETKEIKFRIDTKPILSIFIDTCKDIDCNKKSRTFLKGERVYLDVYGENDNDERVELEKIDGVADKEFNNKDYSFIVNNKGVFDIVVEGENSNYKLLPKRVNYFVIEKSPEIKKKVFQEDKGFIDVIVNFIQSIF